MIIIKERGFQEESVSGRKCFRKKVFQEERVSGRKNFSVRS